jgi:hypothetical protein
MNILILSSSNRNFPLDIHGEITKAGQSAFRFSNLADFLASPLRQKPYLAVVEIGNPEDINRGILAYEWAMSEVVANRFLLLLASKYLQLGEKALRLAGTESATLPMPNKNLLFKIELQLKLLLSEKPKAVTSSLVFQADIPELERTRVLKLKGPLPSEGRWNREAQESPSGKIRWRWVRAEVSEGKETEKVLPTWTLESNSAPVYLQAEKAWQVEDSSANLQSFFGDEEIYSLRQQFANNEPPPPTNEKKSEQAHVPAATVEPVSQNRVVGPDSVENANAAASSATSVESSKHHDPARQASEKVPRPKSPAEQPESLPPTKSTVNKARLPDEQVKESEKTPHETRDDAPKTKKSVAATEQEKISSEQKPEWQEKRSTLPNAVPTPGETQQNIPVINKQAGAQIGITEEMEKKAKYSSSEENSAITDKRRLEILIEESLAPQAAPIIEDAAKISGKKRSFDMQERNRRQVLAEQEEVEGRRKFAEESISLPDSSEKKQPLEYAQMELAAKETTENPAAEDSASRAKELATSAPEDLRKKERDAHTKTEEVESFQSVASSYFHEKEVSKKIVTESVNSTDRAGKIEIDIPSDPQKLETENRIAQHPPKLEVEQTFSQDPNPPPRESDFLKTRHFEILTLAQLNDQNSTWHPVDQFRVYLSAQHRYYGLKDVRDIFPLWIYAGELAPEFLEKEKAWKFYDRGPQRFLMHDPLPVAIARFIQKMAGVSADSQGEISKSRPEDAPSGETPVQPSATPIANWQTSSTSRSAPTAPPSATAAPTAPEEKSVFQFLKKLLGLGK